MVNPNKIRLEFFSTADAPLAYIAGQPVLLSQFQYDVETLAGQIKQSKGETLITTTKRYPFSVALLASWLAGRTAILPPDQRHSTLQNIRSEQAIGIEYGDTGCTPFAVDPSEAEHGRWRIELDGTQPAVTLYTSGSTGTPMAVTKTIGNLLSEAHCIHNTFNWPSGPIMGTVPPQHLYGLTFTILLPWVSGAAWVDEMPLYPQDISNIIQQTQAASLISVPAHYQALLANPMEPIPEFFLSAAAPLASGTAVQWQQQYHHPILEIYGSTETGVIGFRQQPHRAVWQTFDPVRISVNADLLTVSSPFVSPAWASGFQTADQVILTDNNQFELCGRSDSIVKIAGKRVSLNEVEQALAECQGITEASAIAVSVDSLIRDKAVWAVAATAHPEMLSVSQLRTELQKKLDNISIPKRFVFVDKLPRNARGKIQRQAIENLFRVT